MAGNAFPFKIEIFGIDKFTAPLTEVQNRIKSVAKGLESVGSRLTFGISLPLIGAGSLAVHNYMEENKALAQVQAGLTATQGRLGKSMKDLQDSASVLQKNSLFADEDILQNVTAKLLVFGQIGPQVFDRTQKSVVDLATRMGVDLTSATKVVGKALADPIKGMGALGRVGVVFTEQQKKQIKALAQSGQTLKAQMRILDALDAKFAGSAKAARDADPAGYLKNQFSDTLEGFGKIIQEGLIPFVEVISDALSWINDLPESTKRAAVGFGLFLTVLGPIIYLFGLLNSAGVIVVSTFASISLAAKALAGMNLAASFGGIANVLKFFVGLNFWLTAGIVLIGVFWKYIAAFLQGIGQGVAMVFGALSPLFGDLWKNVQIVFGMLKELMQLLGENTAVMNFMREAGKLLGIVIGGVFAALIAPITLVLNLLLEGLKLLGQWAGLSGKIKVPNVSPSFNPAIASFTPAFSAGASEAQKSEVYVKFDNLPAGATVQQQKGNVKVESNTGRSFPGIRSSN